jgi:adenylyltransferase/sulfurtransferase
VREPHEWEIVRIEGADLIPLGDILERMNELDTAEPIALLCKSGVRSAKALNQLREAGFRKLSNVKGGITAWAREIDPSLPVY